MQIDTLIDGTAAQSHIKTPSASGTAAVEFRPTVTRARELKVTLRDTSQISSESFRFYGVALEIGVSDSLRQLDISQR